MENCDEILSKQENTNEENLYDDLYAILNCTSNCTVEQIVTEYKTLALKYHPDKTKTNHTKDKERFNDISIAYNVLSNNEQRAEYDKWQQSGLKIPFLKWISLSQHAQTVHWKSAKPQPTIMYEKPNKEDKSEKHKDINTWNRTHESYESNLSRFRRGEI